AFDRHVESVLWAGFLAISVALAIESWRLWSRDGTRAQKISLGVVGAVVVVVALLDTAVYNIASADHSLITNDEAAAKLPGGGSPRFGSQSKTFAWATAASIPSRRSFNPTPTTGTTA